MDAIAKAKLEVEKLNEEKKLLENAITSKEASDKYI